MHTHTTHKQEDKSRANANNLTKKQSTHTSAFQLFSNRPETVAQRTLQEMVNNSSQVKQLQNVQAITLQPGNSGEKAVIQLQKWRFEKKPRAGDRFEPYGKWHSEYIEKPKHVVVDKDGGPDKKFCEGKVRPMDKLFTGDIFDDCTGDITTALDHSNAVKVKRKEGHEKRDEESERRYNLQRGEGMKSERVKKQKQELRKKRESELEIDLDTGIHHMGGDSPGHDYDFEDEGLHSAVIKRVELQYIEQVKNIEEDKIDLIEWFKMPEELRIEIIKYQQLAEKNQDQIHHSIEDRPKYTSSVLGSGTKERPPLKEDTKHTGIGWSIDNLSHSIPYAQVPDTFRHSDEGGVNHPKNIPYENKVTNQVVNVAIEKIGQKFLDKDKSITKVTMRIWGLDRVERSIHVYFTQDYKYPLVFGTRDLGNKLPLRLDK